MSLFRFQLEKKIQSANAVRSLRIVVHIFCAVVETLDFLLFRSVWIAFWSPFRNVRHVLILEINSAWFVGEFI